MSELRECPFCGGTPFLSIVEDVDYAECSSCHVYADVKHWNQRATPAPVASREGWSLTKDDLLRMCADEGDIRRGYREISIAVFEEIRRMALSALSPAATAPVADGGLARALRGLMLAAETAYRESAAQGYRMRADGAEALDTMKLVMEQIKERVQIDWTGSADLSGGENE